ncbi:MAG: hypothetical protein JEY91_11620 [Spirochaetaceae bacterium]|nr:hypothetical protein [Spirochaetaceae bacterium]
MKIFKICSIVLLLSILVSCSEKDQGILINNNSDTYTIEDVSIVQSTAIYYGDNLLGDSIIDTSSSRLFDLEPGAYHVLVIDDYNWVFEVINVAVVQDQVTELVYDGFSLAARSSARSLITSETKEKRILEPDGLLINRY